MRSMTGFGQSILEVGGLQVQVTLQSVNHRYLDLVLRLPDELRFLEAALRERLQNATRRGRCEASISLRRAAEADVVVEVRTAAIRRLLAACEPLLSSGEVSGPLTLGDLARSPALLRIEKTPAQWESSEDATVWSCLDAALAQFEGSRAAEGERIAEALSAILARLVAVRGALAERLPVVRRAIASNLRERLAEWTREAGISEERMLAEIASSLERSDVQEEMDRFGAHLEQFREVSGREGPLGRHLDFLAQELLRELNTLCAKCRDTQVVQLGLDARLLCEQIREQVQNVE